MSDVLPDCRWQIQIKQRGGKWVMWCYCGTEVDMTVTWLGIAALRRKARLLDGGAVIAYYEPPTVTFSRKEASK